MRTIKFLVKYFLFFLDITKIGCSISPEICFKEFYITRIEFHIKFVVIIKLYNSLVSCLGIPFTYIGTLTNTHACTYTYFNKNIDTSA